MHAWGGRLLQHRSLFVRYYIGHTMWQQSWLNVVLGSTFPPPVALHCRLEGGRDNARNDVSIDNGICAQGCCAII